MIENAVLYLQGQRRGQFSAAMNSSNVGLNNTSGLNSSKSSSLAAQLLPAEEVKKRVSQIRRCLVDCFVTVR